MFTLIKTVIANFFHLDWVIYILLFLVGFIMGSTLGQPTIIVNSEADVTPQVDRIFSEFNN